MPLSLSLSLSLREHEVQTALLDTNCLSQFDSSTGHPAYLLPFRRIRTIHFSICPKLHPFPLFPFVPSSPSFLPVLFFSIGCFSPLHRLPKLQSLLPPFILRFPLLSFSSGSVASFSTSFSTAFSTSFPSSHARPSIIPTIVSPLPLLSAGDLLTCTSPSTSLTVLKHPNLLQAVTYMRSS